MKKRLWILGVCLCLLMATGCVDGNTPLDSDTRPSATNPTRTQPTVDGYAYRFFTKEVSDGKDLVGIMDSAGNVTCEAQFSAERCGQYASDRFYVERTNGDRMIADERGNVVIAIESFTEDNGAISSHDSYDAEERASLPLRFYVNGYIYDEDGNVLSEKYDRMRRADQDGRLRVWAECAEGLFLLDENGRRIERLDEVKTVSPLFDGAFSLTSSEGFKFTRYGVRTASGEVVLEERYRTVYALSEERFVGADTAIPYSDDAEWTNSVFVDENGTVLCDRFNSVAFFQMDDGGYYPFGVARWVEHYIPPTPTTDPLAIPDEEIELPHEEVRPRYEIVDWSGQSLSGDLIAVGYRFQDGVITLQREDGADIYFSALGGSLIR